jgi:hypothetical protein
VTSRDRLDVVGAVAESAVLHARRFVAGQAHLATVLRDAASERPARVPVLVVAQDEYAHDVVLPFDRAAYLVYDVT